MNTDTVWQPNASATSPGELATCLTQAPAPETMVGRDRGQRSAIPTDLLLLASNEASEGVDTGDQFDRLRGELEALGVTPIVWHCLGRRRDCLAEESLQGDFDRALALRGFHWGRRFDHSWRSKRGIVLGGGASLRDKLTVKAGIEAVTGFHGLIAFYVADDAEGDKSYLGADGDLALFGEISSLRGTAGSQTVNRFSSASIQIGQSSGILETPALASALAVATARVLHALMPAACVARP